jgi:hypothetical protein
VSRFRRNRDVSKADIELVKTITARDIKTSEKYKVKNRKKIKKAVDTKE